jgi:hypothetical protein
MDLIFLQNNSILNKNFNYCVNGFHLINTGVINEKIWEEINTQVFIESGLSMTYMSSGSHQSGTDIICNGVSFSNKSAKKTLKNHISLSSYRMTTICNNKDVGTEEKIINEINKRKNFDYYSIIVRKETKKELEYIWYILPSNLDILNPSKYKWKPYYNKKNIQTGWITNKINNCYMKIVFSMSSQLWIFIDTNELNKYKITDTKITTKNKLNYISIFKSFTTSSSTSSSSSSNLLLDNST